MSQLMCSYHPKNIAIDKCERCQRPICLIGKNVYHKKHSSGTGSHRRTWSTTHIYCPPCYADVLTNATSGPGAIFSLMFFIVIGGFVTIAFFSFGGPLGFIPLLMIGLAIYSFIEKGRKAELARAQERKFLNSLDQEPSGIERKQYSKFNAYARPDKKWKSSEVSCFNCGYAIDLEANFCMNCGDSTMEEKTYLSND